MQESWEGYGKNWTHFVYKTDNLFQSIRISYGNSSVTKGFHFLKLIWTPNFLCVQNAPFKATSSFFNPFWLLLLFFMHLLIILSYKTTKLKSISNELWKGWKLAWHHHFIHIACARKLEGYGKNWMHFMYKTDNLFRSIRVSYGNSSVTLIWTPLFFCVQNAPFKAKSSIYNPFWLHLLFFMHLLIILSYKTMKLKSIWNELWKGSKLAWYHHFTHVACARK